MADLLPDFIRDHTYFALFALMWAETLLPVFPAEMVMPLGGLMASQGVMSLPGAACAGAAGSVTGAVGWYWVARALGYDRFRRLMARFGRVTTVSPEEIDWLQRWFDRFGATMVLVGRVVPGIRTAVSIPAGLVRMPFPRFLALTAAGALISSGTLAWLGSLLGGRYTIVEHYTGPVSTTIVAGAILLWLARLILQYRRVRADRK